MAALHGSVNVVDDEDGYYEHEHEFEALAQEFIDQEDWHEAATSRNYLKEEIITNKPFYQEMQPNKILNVAQPVIFDDKSLKIPSILEVIDLEKKVFKVSAVALKKAPIMMCLYKHCPLSFEDW